VEVGAIVMICVARSHILGIGGLRWK